MARQSWDEGSQYLYEADFIYPEPVRGMGKVGSQQGESGPGGECMGRERGIREYADEGGLGQGACCPSFARVAREPVLDLLMRAVSGPSHREKNVDVQQETGFHSNSSWSFSTSSVPTDGEPGGNSTTNFYAISLRR